MKLSERMQACADLVKPGSRVADIGTDHGYLPIYLLQSGICPEVTAADLREKPLETARNNARAAGVEPKLHFVLSDGLKNISLEQIDTVICAGMGGDLIAQILSDGAEARDSRLQLILQPQSSVSDLRCFLGRNGFRILREIMAEDAGFIYTVMEVQWTGAADTLLSVGACFIPQGETKRTGARYHRYMERVLHNTEKTVAGLRRAKKPNPEKLRWYEAGLAVLKEWEANNENSQ